MSNPKMEIPYVDRLVFLGAQWSRLKAEVKNAGEDRDSPHYVAYLAMYRLMNAIEREYE